MKRTLQIKLIWMITLISLVITGCHAASVSDYNIVWDSPSADFNGTMPIGNGDIGANVWVEDDGDLLFYISKTDAWDDNGRLVKVGRIRVKLNPAPSTSTFVQTLVLENATVQAVYGQGSNATTIRLWVDANRPIIHITADGPTPKISAWKRSASKATRPCRSSSATASGAKDLSRHASTSGLQARSARSAMGPAVNSRPLMLSIAWSESRMRRVLL